MKLTIIKRIINKGYKLFYSRKKIEHIEPTFIPYNIYRTSYNKKALVSFITQPFILEETSFAHTNIVECKTICEILNELHFTVDVVDYNDYQFISNHNYNVIVGFGEPIEKELQEAKTKDFKLILYRNGCDTSYSDQASLKRVEQIQKENGRLLINSARVNRESWRAQIRFADKLIVLGNSFVAETFKQETNANIQSLDLFYYDVGVIDLSKKDFVSAKNNFLWFGSRGAVHKGLDLVLKYFETNKNKNLFICGLHEHEKDFIEAYQSILNQENVYNLGFVPLSSPEFTELLYKCGAIVFPSVSEGGGGALLNVTAAGGLIPIITKGVGLDFGNNHFEIKAFSNEDVAAAINEFDNLTATEIESKARILRKYIREKHSFQGYRSKLKSIFESTLIR